MNGRRNAAAAADELRRRENVDGHDGCAAEEAAEFDHLANLVTGNRNNSNGGSLVVHNADGHFVGNDLPRHV